MVAKGVRCGGTVLVLTKGVFVNDARITRVVEEGWFDPWLSKMLACSGGGECSNLDDEPTADVHTSDLLGTIGKAWGEGASGGEDECEGEEGKGGIDGGGEHADQLGGVCGSGNLYMADGGGAGQDRACRR